MNLKNLIKFGMEESQEPVIKNPILRQALEPRTMDQASLQDDLEPGPLKDEMLKDFDPSQETYEEYLQRKSLGERPFNMSDGGRIPFAGGRKVRIGPNKGKYYYYIGKGDNYRSYYADSPTDGEAWVKENRMRKGYDKKFGTKITMTEKNKAAQKMFGKNYNELPPTGPKSQKTVYDRIYGTFKTKTDKPGKFKVKTQASELSATDQAKIKKVYPEAKFTKKKYVWISTRSSSVW